MCRLRVTLQNLAKGLSGNHAAGLSEEGSKLSVLLKGPCCRSGHRAQLLCILMYKVSVCLAPMDISTGPTMAVRQESLWS